MSGDRVWNGDKKIKMGDDYLSEEELREYFDRHQAQIMDAEKKLIVSKKLYDDLLKVENETKN